MVARAMWYDGSHGYKDFKNGPELVCCNYLQKHHLKRRLEFGNLGFSKPSIVTHTMTRGK